MLLLYGDMLVKTTNDYLFAHSVPASVMRAEVDAKLLKRRPSSTNFQTGTSQRKTRIKSRYLRKTGGTSSPEILEKDRW